MCNQQNNDPAESAGSSSQIFNTLISPNIIKIRIPTIRIEFDSQYSAKLDIWILLRLIPSKIKNSPIQ